MALTQINPLLRVVTPLGRGLAYAWWPDEQEIYWGVFQERGGESWWWPNPAIRFQPSITDGLLGTSPIKLDPETEQRIEVIRKKLNGEPTTTSA